MLALYIILIACPLAVFLWTFRISHDFSYHSIGTHIFNGIMYAYGVAGTVGVFLVRSWSLTKFFVFTFGYGIPAIIALVVYWTYLDKKKPNTVNEEKMYIKQTI